jgi:hypothetical protein
MITERTINELIENLASIQTKFSDLVERSNQLEVQIRDLEHQGFDRGSVYMYMNDNIYSIYPMNDGRRERKYICTDVGKQIIAREAQYRVVEYDKLAAEYHRVNQLLLNTMSILNQCFISIS